MTPTLYYVETDNLQFFANILVVIPIALKEKNSQNWEPMKKNPVTIPWFIILFICNW